MTGVCLSQGAHSFEDTLLVQQRAISRHYLARKVALLMKSPNCSILSWVEGDAGRTIKVRQPVLFSTASYIWLSLMQLLPLLSWLPLPASVCFPSPTSLYCQRAAPLKSMSSIEEISKAAITADLARNLTPLIISWVSTWKHLTPTDHLWKTWRGCANDGHYWKPVPAVFVNHRARVGPYQARYCTFLPTRLLSLRSLL